jgi:tetratricopeptide (TPR) repeat protein
MDSNTCSMAKPRRRLGAVGLAALLVAGCATPVPVSSVPPPPGVSAPENKPETIDVQREARVSAAAELARQGRRLLDSGDADGAIRTLERAVSLNPADGHNYFYLAEAWLAKVNAHQADEFNRLAESYFQGDPDWLIRIARQRDRIEEMNK